MQPIKKILIANRGEIARRILRSAKNLGYKVGVIIEERDLPSLIEREADHLIKVSTYLSSSEIATKAKEWGATLLHPGYGLLSENSDFAKAVEEAGITFLGPRAETMAALGNKERAKEVARKCKIPTLNSLSGGELLRCHHNKEKIQQLLKENKLTFPLLIKASGGGGGKGMRIVHDEDTLIRNLEIASIEAKAAFGDEQVFVEKYLSSPRHIEVQIFGDGKGAGLFLGERECSLQRRYQKIIEEAPSVAIHSRQRELLREYAMKLIKETAYRSAGTIEFLLSEGEFYFLEVNTRLQVEHPVTENITDLDLVHLQILIGEGVWPVHLLGNFLEGNFSPKGHSIEARIIAEDCDENFIPSPGLILYYDDRQAKKFARIDSGVSTGSTVWSYYDSMIAKVISYGETRAEAILNLEKALLNFIILGVKHNIPFLLRLLKMAAFREGDLSTHFISERLEEIKGQEIVPKNIKNYIVGQKFLENLVTKAESHPLKSIPAAYLPRTPFPSHTSTLVSEIENVFEYEIRLKDNSQLCEELRTSYYLNLFPKIDQKIRLTLTSSPSHYYIHFLGETFTLSSKNPFDYLSLSEGSDTGDSLSPVGGKVSKVVVQKGDSIAKGEILFYIESMKMQFEVKAEREGKIDELLAFEGMVVKEGEILCHISKL